MLGGSSNGGGDGGQGSGRMRGVGGGMLLFEQRMSGDIVRGVIA